jgi:hypothetical protein
VLVVEVKEERMKPLKLFNLTQHETMIICDSGHYCIAKVVIRDELGSGTSIRKEVGRRKEREMGREQTRWVESGSVIFHLSC